MPKPYPVDGPVGGLARPPSRDEAVDIVARILRDVDPLHPLMGYVRASNIHDHRAHVKGFNVTPEQVAALNQIVDDPRSPFRGHGDFYRTAGLIMLIVWHVILNGQVDGLPDTLDEDMATLLRAESLIHRMEVDALYAERADKIVAAIDSAAEQEDWERVRAYVEDADRLAQSSKWGVRTKMRATVAKWRQVLDPGQES